MFKKKITSQKELQEALDKLYNRVDKKLVEKFNKTDEPERKALKHTVTGCSNCPFVRKEDGQNVYCLWDREKMDIQNFVECENIVPVSCPMISNNIEINLRDE